MMNTATPQTSRVHDFATAVRNHLSDLSADEIEELTDGLEADLAEQAADDATHDLGDPTLYADELRAAAGLPVRGKAETSTSSFSVAGLRARATAGRRNTAARIRATTAGEWMLDLLVLLRPVWWLLRGWALFELASVFGPSAGGQLLPTSVVGWAFLLAFVVASIQWGRGRWMPWRWLAPVKVVLSVVAMLALPILLGDVLAAVNQQSSDVGYSEPSAAAGLALNGSQISNIFAYDAAGNPLTGIQLFDQDGKPLTTVSDPGTAEQPAFADDGSAAYVPSAHSRGDAGWNVYPLDIIRLPLSGEPDLSKAATAVPPFATALPLTGGTSTSTSIPTPGSTSPGSTAVPTPSPTPAVPTPTAGPTTGATAGATTPSATTAPTTASPTTPSTPAP